MATSGKKLNVEQLQAVRHGKGPLLIIAGAGTGKTTVITERIKYLIEKKVALPSEILALTFTEKAAAEMQERIDVALPYGYTQMWISTFHAFCDRVLKDEALHIGLNPAYKLNTQSESIQFFRSNLFKFDLKYFRPLGNPTKFVDGMIQHFSRLQDEDISPLDYVQWAQDQKSKVKSQNENLKLKNEEEKIESDKWEELANAYKTYDELKTKAGVMDFGDLIIKTLELFRKRPNVLREYQKKFRYLLVDEFQDTNISQNELVKLLAGKEGNITVVLDDDQSIYRFRGAAVSNALYFRKNFPKAKIVTLVKNYRSSQEILDKAYNLIQFNNPDRLEVIEKIDKKLVSQVKYKDTEIKLIHKDRVENEAEAVSHKIAEIVKGGGHEFRDFAILVRANNHADPFIRALVRNGIPHQFLGPGRLFKQPEIVDLISFLKVIYDFEDSVSMYRLLSMEYFEIEARDLIKITNYAKWKNLSLFEACEKVDDIFLSDETKEKIDKLIKVISDQQGLVNKESAGQILYNFLNETGLILKLLNPDTPLAERRAKNISKFFDKLKTYEVEHEDAGVRAVVDWIDLASELGESPLAADSDWTEINAVNILTVHSSKGLEFPIVFLVNLVSQRFPTTQRREQIPIPDELIKETLPKGDYHLEEERRLFYVGVTRAKEKLYLTAANFYGEGKREKKLSPFIFETLGDGVVKSEVSEEKGEQLSFNDYQPTLPNLQPTTRNLQQIHIDYLSYSQIETFRICPLHYKLKYIYKLPTPPSSAQSFGTSIHTALRDFYRLVGSGGKRSERLLMELLEKNWIDEGYQSKNHEQKNKQRGANYLKGYYKKSFNPKNMVEGTEVPFTIPLVSDGERPLKIGGRIDRVDTFPNGKIELIDYKTSEKPPTQKEMEKNADIGRQLAFYAIAATNIKEKPFNKKPEDIILSFYFFETQTKISTVRTAQQLEEAKKEIFKAREEIESSEFKCSGNMLCENCEYKLFCKTDEN
ncbi:MAG: hypothetical protein UT39_C0004G0062 [Candidatus Woesebacteria bacterium GW2011_GWA1_39_21]|uniref:DNA 3'-5' helicase n=1 Tax=Candidatus Woesebacteria bacterium GW2011_GWA1_39_21 TaxID=1618550 RepID=A0A0G0N8E1_9BACT|nr:MAG: hypothetical protein UT39_C0004G0062 [Candidatus Woesebacteria bacterium GW2011_GWA1_39_21]